MSDERVQRKSTVRQALQKKLEKKQRKIVGKLRGRYLFRAAVRLVMEYKDWIGDDYDSEVIGDNVAANVKMVKSKKKAEENILSCRDRGVLLIIPDKRSKEDIAHIECLLRDVNAFKRYPEDIREELAGVVKYQHIPAGRTLVRQGHKARRLYYIVHGKLQIFTDTTDELTGEVTQNEVGQLEPGDIFGEIALLHNVPRTSTVVSKSAKLIEFIKQNIFITAVDVLILSSYAFNMYVRNVLMTEWNILRDALVNFNYFKGWSEETMRECCILSKIVNYKPNEILLGDGKGMVHYVYFLLNGECRLIEHILVEKVKVRNKVKYRLYDSKQEIGKSIHSIGRAPTVRMSVDNLSTLIMDGTPELNGIETEEKDQTAAAEDYIKLIASKKSHTNIAMERISVITVTLQDVINEWHEITDAVEMLMKKPSISNLTRYPENVRTVFMQICLFYRGACFGLGEEMKNRRVVASTPSTCLLVPRYWLTQHNRANIWARVKQFMNSKYPTNKQLLNKYMDNKKWVKYRREYANNIVSVGRKVPNDTKICDVPYSIRINENIEDQ